MQAYTPYLEGLAGQSRAMADLVADWVGISTASHDVKGLAILGEKVKAAFPVPLSRETVTGRTIVDRAVQHIPDMESPDLPEFARSV